MTRREWLSSVRQLGGMPIVFLALVIAGASCLRLESDSIYLPSLIGTIISLLVIGIVIDKIVTRIDFGRESDNPADRRIKTLAELHKITSDIENLERLRAALLQELQDKDDSALKEDGRSNRSL